MVNHLFLVSSIATMKVTAAEKKGTCMKLREQLEALEKESSTRLAEIERYNKDMQVCINTEAENGLPYFLLYFFFLPLPRNGEIHYLNITRINVVNQKMKNIL